MAIIGTVALALILLCRKSSPQARQLITTPLGYLCLLTYPISLIAWNLAGLGDHIENVIPLHLCDLAAFACGIALITRNQRASELAYFWGLAGTIQGLITPAIPVSFPHPVFSSFFIQHGIIVVTALLLPLGLGWRPSRHSVLRIFIITQLYVAVAMLFNLFTGSNFGFLAKKPTTASLLDILPDWPYYILILEIIALVIYTLLYLPFLKSNKSSFKIETNPPASDK